MELPEDLVERIAETCVRAGGLKEWCRSWRGTCRRFSSLRWFEAVARGGVPLCVVPSDRCPTVQLGVSLARSATEDAVARAAATRRALSRIAGRSDDDDDDDDDDDGWDVLGTGPTVLVTPGVHRENVRLTRTCALIGWGSRGSAVIEGSGWEPALAFAGLGMSERGTGDTMGWSIGDTGERSVACNLSIRVRNRAQAFAVSVVNGAPKFVRCDLRGGLLVLGWKTSPGLLRCVVRDGRGSGVKVTDHGEVRLEACAVERCGTHGLLLERGGRAVLAGGTVVRDNDAEAVLHTPDTRGVAVEGEGVDLGPPAMVRIGLPREDDSGKFSPEGESGRVSVLVRPNVRRLRAGAETLEHLHGASAPNYAWLKRGGFAFDGGDGDYDDEEAGSDEDEEETGSDFDDDDDDEGVSAVRLALRSQPREPKPPEN